MSHACKAGMSHIAHTRASMQVLSGLEAVSQGVLPEVARRYAQFWQCNGCGGVFWEGSVFEKAREHYSPQHSGNSLQSSTAVTQQQENRNRNKRNR